MQRFSIVIKDEFFHLCNGIKRLLALILCSHSESVKILLLRG